VEIKRRPSGDRYLVPVAAAVEAVGNALS
jgi:hypothetical protein